MNALSTQRFSVDDVLEILSICHAVVDRESIEQASRAIQQGHLGSLGMLLNLGTVNGNSRTSDGRTLLMHALNPPNDPLCTSFRVLTDHLSLRRIAPDLTLADGKGRTLLHHMAMGVGDWAFNPAYHQWPLYGVMENFLLDFTAPGDFGRLDSEQCSAAAWAARLNKPHMETAFQIFASCTSSGSELSARFSGDCGDESHA